MLLPFDDDDVDRDESLHDVDGVPVVSITADKDSPVEATGASAEHEIDGECNVD